MKYRNNAGRKDSEEEKLFSDNAIKTLIMATKNNII